MRKIHKQNGMTLVEILIAMLIGAFLLGGVMQIFLSTKQSYRVQDGLSRIQENARFAMDFLAKDVRASGFIGCNSKIPLANAPGCTSPVGCQMPNVLNSPASMLNNFAAAVQGFEARTALGAGSATWSPTLDASITLPVGGSDVIAIRRAEDTYFTVKAHTGSAAQITLDSTATTDNLKTAGILNNNSQNACATVIVNDCASASIFQVTGITGFTNNQSTTLPVLSHLDSGGACTLMNATPELGKAYEGAQVYPVNTVVYYVRNNSAEPPQPSLYRKIGTDQAQELVEGVEQMQILYGVDADATPDGYANYYVKANEVPNDKWPNIVSVKITLTLLTVEQGISSAAGGRIKRNFSTTIALRNLIN